MVIDQASLKVAMYENKPVAISSYVSIMLWIQNENVIRIFKLQILNKAIKKHFHQIQVHLPQSIFIFPV